MFRNVEFWLETKPVYTLYQKSKNAFKRHKVLSRGIGYQYQADLVDYSALKRDNSGFTLFYDGQIYHPFRCWLLVPHNLERALLFTILLMHQDDIIDVTFDYVIIVLGTVADKNKILGSLPQQISNGIVQVIKLKKKY